jgi:hypothetical protein
MGGGVCNVTLHTSRGGWRGVEVRNVTLCTGGLSNALFMSLLISKLFCTKGCMGEAGERAIVNSLPPAREGGGVVRGQNEFIFRPSTVHTCLIVNK